MSKEAFIKRHRERLDLTYEQAKKEIDGLTETISQMILNGETVTLGPIGSLSVKDTAPRMGRNPRTGETITIPEGKQLKLNVFPTFKEKIKK